MQYIDVQEVSEWVGDDGAIVVYHMCEGTSRESVLGVQFEDAAPYAPGIIELARWRLRKLKQALSR